MSSLVIRLWFGVAVAFVALALADPLTEWASNAGLFGAGNFTDHSNADVFPALFVGFAFFALHVVMRARHISRHHQGRPQAWLGAWARALDARTLTRLLPGVFAVQIGALYLMETSEQLVVLGHGVGGTVWLGAPILVSLTIHAAFCAISMFAISRVVRAFAKTALRIAQVVAVLAARGPRESGLVLRRLRYSPAPFDFAPLVCLIGERAPPFAIT
jgi:hypothetical protein